MRHTKTVCDDLCTIANNIQSPKRLNHLRVLLMHTKAVRDGTCTIANNINHQKRLII